MKKSHVTRIVIRDIALCAMLGALMLAVQIVLAPLPNVELVSFLIIMSTLTLGFRALGAVYVFVLLEGLVYGFGMWWINYLYIWAVLFFAVYFIEKIGSVRTNPLFWAIISGLFGFSFGLLCSIPYFFVGGWAAAFSYWVSGIPFDIPHCIGNFALMLVLFKPVYAVMEKLSRKMFSPVHKKDINQENT